MSDSHDLTTVVLVENNPQLSKHLQKTLGLIEEIELVNVSMSAQEAVEAIRDLKPEVALIEYDLPDMNGIALTEMLRRDYPGTQVVLISQDNYTDLVLKAVRAGACDFITHDVSIKELTDVLRRASQLSLAERQRQAPSAGLPAGPTPMFVPGRGGNGRLITVYSPKGGTGATTIAANLALALMDNEARVTLVDGCLQYGDAHMFFNELGQFSVLDLIPRIYDLDISLVESVMLLNRATGLYILPAPPRPEFAEKITGENFSRILEFIRRFSDYIVVNTHSFISDPVLAALDAGDVVVLVVEQQINAIRNVRLFLDLWDALGMSRERIVLVMSRYRKDHPITVEKVSERLKHMITMTIPEDVEAAQKADALGIPILRSSKDSAIAQSFVALAEHVRKRLINLERAESPRMRLFAVT
ncbi:response regulator [uncultured Thermanaerothrix sp.]|uniref:response regulator n=1 Tax=uncultured Thermanaerothrix sp. TaxID=1195149 RepID=UPI0026168D06|nr:response regulator [uncultured Thermanaerothrix sp.]